MKHSNLILKALLTAIVSIVFCTLGIAFLVLKTVSIPFVPNRNIDNMSDYYTAVWKSINDYSIDNERITVIDISESTREEIARILSVVKDMHPSIIGLDVSLIWDKNEDADSIYLETIKSIPNLILPVEYTETDQGQGVFLYDKFHNEQFQSNYGVVSFPDNDDILRTFQPSFTVGDTVYRAFACTIAEMENIDISKIYTKDKLFINYTTLAMSDEDAIPSWQFLDLDSAKYNVLSNSITNKIVLIGSTHLTSDHHQTPLGYSLSGVMIHAHIINSLLENKMIYSVPLVLRFIICFILAYLLLWSYTKRNKKNSKPKNIWGAITKALLLLVISLGIFGCVGTFLYCNCCYYVDFAPYIVTFILTKTIKDINFKLKEK